MAKIQIAKRSFQESMNERLDKMVSRGVKSGIRRGSNGRSVLLKVRKAYSVLCHGCYKGEFVFIPKGNKDHITNICPWCNSKTVEIIASRTYKV
jgi:Zn finger protein HypA/HybF involved in hydrogenase expression